MIKYFLGCLLIGLAMVSCKGNDSLQKYFVESSEKPNFTLLDFSPKSFIKEEQLNTEEEKKVLKAIKKMNVLIYRNDDEIAYQSEVQRVSHMLESYDELIRYHGSFGKGKVILKKDENPINELVVELNGQQKGFILVRLLGDNISANNLFQMGLLLKNNKEIPASFEKLLHQN